ncbi:hypothetical protein Metal_0803 [Methylomicrobium album BG8]|uniref:Uncharacterized protein n=1 Tax=Methylomicrobium album BG8 TaxID=686340 RepID=H8GQX5_METAL|nr:hypothetical protein Metal_0803 [Methylomicrobium album BG8]
MFSAMGLSVATFRFTVSGQPDKDKTIGAANIDFPGNNEEKNPIHIHYLFKDKKPEIRFV